LWSFVQISSPDFHHFHLENEYILTVDGISGKASQNNLSAPQAVMLTPEKNTL